MFSVRLLTRSSLLVAECGGSEWVETALIWADNKEVFEGVHKGLTIFMCKYKDFSMTARKHQLIAATLPPLDKDAERDV